MDRLEEEERRAVGRVEVPRLIHRDELGQRLRQLLYLHRVLNVRTPTEQKCEEGSYLRLIDCWIIQL